MYRRQIVITHVNKTTVVKVILENITYLVCIDGCIIGQEQNSNKMYWPSPKFTPSRFEPKTKKAIPLFCTQIQFDLRNPCVIFSYAFKKRSFGCNLEVLQSKNCCLIAPFTNVILNVDIRSPSPSLGNSRFACWPQHICTHRMDAIRVMYVCFLLKNIREEIQFGL